MENLLITGLVALCIASIGFYKYVYFFSIGYGFSIAGISIALLIKFHEILTPGIVVLCALLIAYGLRLGLYLLIREIKSAAYRKFMNDEIKEGSKMGFGPRAAIWIFCALLYVCQTAPVVFRLNSFSQSLYARLFENGWDGFLIAGIILAAIGFILEAAADIQKTLAKKVNPNKFVSTGLFKVVRCPNYLGELVLWTGVFVSGLNMYGSAWEWIISIIGFLGISYVMFSGARRLELRQNKVYGSDPAYKAYVKKTPIIIPLIPLYSVAKYKWLVA